LLNTIISFPFRGSKPTPRFQNLYLVGVDITQEFSALFSPSIKLEVSQYSFNGKGDEAIAITSNTATSRSTVVATSAPKPKEAKATEQKKAKLASFPSVASTSSSPTEGDSAGGKGSKDSKSGQATNARKATNTTAPKQGRTPTGSTLSVTKTTATAVNPSKGSPNYAARFDPLMKVTASSLPKYNSRESPSSGAFQQAPSTASPPLPRKGVTIFPSVMIKALGGESESDAMIIEEEGDDEMELLDSSFTGILAESDSEEGGSSEYLDGKSHLFLFLFFL
jgi:hypothetical protein